MIRQIGPADAPLDYVTPSEYLSAQLGIAAQFHVCSTIW